MDLALFVLIVLVVFLLLGGSTVWTFSTIVNILLIVLLAALIWRLVAGRRVL